MKLIEKKSNDYKREITVKDTIICHFTAGGSLAGAESTLAKPDGVNVQYIIDRDGTICHYFPDEFWAHHCGKKMWSKRSIAIEIVNWGGLTQSVDGLWLPWTGKKSQAVPESQVVHLPPWRGYEAWQLLTPEQVDALSELLARLIVQHPIRILKTHADIVFYKTDFHPRFEQIYGTFKKFIQT